MEWLEPAPACRMREPRLALSCALSGTNGEEERAKWKCRPPAEQVASVAARCLSAGGKQTRAGRSSSAVRFTVRPYPQSAVDCSQAAMVSASVSSELQSSRWQSVARFTARIRKERGRLQPAGNGFHSGIERAAISRRWSGFHFPVRPYPQRAWWFAVSWHRFPLRHRAGSKLPPSVSCPLHCPPASAKSAVDCSQLAPVSASASSEQSSSRRQSVVRSTVRLHPRRVRWFAARRRWFPLRYQADSKSPVGSQLPASPSARIREERGGLQPRPPQRGASPSAGGQSSASPSGRIRKERDWLQPTGNGLRSGIERAAKLSRQTVAASPPARIREECGGLQPVGNGFRSGIERTANLPPTVSCPLYRPPASAKSAAVCSRSVTASAPASSGQQISRQQSVVRFTVHPHPRRARWFAARRRWFPLRYRAGGRLVRRQSARGFRHGLFA